MPEGFIDFFSPPIKELRTKASRNRDKPLQQPPSSNKPFKKNSPLPETESIEKYQRGYHNRVGFISDLDSTDLSSGRASLDDHQSSWHCESNMFADNLSILPSIHHSRSCCIRAWPLSEMGSYMLLRGGHEWISCQNDLCVL